MKKAFLVLLLSGTFALAACGTTGSLHTSVDTSTTSSQPANNGTATSTASGTAPSVSSNHSAATSSKVPTNISVKGVNPKVSKQTVTSVQAKVNEVTNLNNKLSQGEQDVSINAN